MDSTSTRIRSKQQQVQALKAEVKKELQHIKLYYPAYVKTLTFGAIGLFTLTKYVDKYISPKYKGYMELVAIIGMAWGYVDYYKIYQLDIDQQRQRPLSENIDKMIKAYEKKSFF